MGRNQRGQQRGEDHAHGYDGRDDGDRIAREAVPHVTFEETAKAGFFHILRC